MQFARLNDLTHHYQTLGPIGPRPLLVFVNSLGTDFRIWRDVVVRLAGDYSILLYDMRGHGLSDVGAVACSVEELADDTAALIEHVGARKAIVCGVSLGGLVAQQLYRQRPDLVVALVLTDTLPRIGDAAFWDARIGRIERDGLEPIADAILERWFTPVFREADGAGYAGYRNMLLRQPVDGYIAACGAVRDADLGAAVPAIDVPTLCMVGDSDLSTPPEEVAAFAKSIPHARFEIIKACGHLPSIEQPDLFAGIMRAFIGPVGTETLSHVTH